MLQGAQHIGSRACEPTFRYSLGIYVGALSPFLEKRAAMRTAVAAGSVAGGAHEQQQLTPLENLMARKLSR